MTDRARKAMGLARAQSQRLNHAYVGSEHLLLGIVQEGGGVAAAILGKLDIDLKTIQQEVEKVVKPGPSAVTMGQIPFTRDAIDALDLASEEAANRFEADIGTDDLLVGLIRERNGAAAKVLTKLEAELGWVRKEIASSPREPRSR
jgi:ATP-dependent Clp protease ATP-binding subunit ClpC